MKIAVCSGGFDPLHSGHLASFEAARMLADRLYVAVNSDDWLRRKKGRAFMPLLERVALVGALRCVDQVMAYFDDSDGSCCAALEEIKRRHPNDPIIFCNGGDRTRENIPGMRVPGIDFQFEIGGNNKANSSSWILEEWKAPKTTRPWGYYRVLHEAAGVKVKELTVDPGAALSMQRHQGRSEFWLVAEGTATVDTIDSTTTDVELNGVFDRHQYLHISRNEWHQLINNESNPLKIIEIQYGEQCEEADIERRTTQQPAVDH